MEMTPTAPVAHVTSLDDDPLEHFLAGQLSERTRRAYQADVKAFFAFLGIERADLDSLVPVTFQHVVAFRNELAQRGYKRTTINRKLASIKALFKMIVAAGCLERNPADSALVRGYKVEEKMSGKALATQSLKAIEQAISEEEDELKRTRDMAIFQLLTYGGLRRSEVAAICWDDIHQESVFHILTLSETKSGVAQEIKLQPIVIHHFNSYREALDRHNYDTSGNAFISLAPNKSHGKALSDQSINLIVKKYALRAGVSQVITAHMFRHTCCTLAIEGGAKPQQVQAHLRHKDLKTTMRYYENRERLTDNASDYIKLT